LKIAVLVKQVPSSEASIRVASDGRTIDPADVQWIVNPYDEYALEAALQLKEKFGGEAVAFSLGGAKGEEAMRTCLALGLDRAVLIRDAALSAADAQVSAKVLAAAIRRFEPDLVLGGKLSIDQENSAVGVMVAQFLGLPHVSVVSKLEAESAATLKVHREIEGGAEVVTVDLPAVLTANKGLNEPRYASLKGIMAAKKKPLEVLDIAALGLDPASLEPTAAVQSLEYPPARTEGKVVQGDARDSARELVAYLRDQAKLI
jgi:electron transfer flavoprotein beta subunit